MDQPLCVTSVSPRPRLTEMTANPCGEIEDQTGQPQTHFPLPAHHDRHPLLSRPVAKIGDQIGQPLSPFPALDNRQPLLL